MLIIIVILLWIIILLLFSILRRQSLSHVHIIDGLNSIAQQNAIIIRNQKGL